MMCAQSIGFYNTQFNGPIGQQHTVPGLDIAGKVGIAGTGAYVVSNDFGIGCNFKVAPGLKESFAFLKFSETDFGPLQIDEDTYGAAHEFADFPNSSYRFCMILLSSMAGIQAEQVNACIH